MAITLVGSAGNYEFPSLEAVEASKKRLWQTSQTFGYEETDTRQGMTARQWQITGLLLPEEWIDLLSFYDTWRGDNLTGRMSDDSNTKVLRESDDIATAVANTTTVEFSGDGVRDDRIPVVQEWNNISTWFTEAPTGEQVGAYIKISFGLIDVEQAFEVLAKEEEIAQEGDVLPDYGTYTINGVVLTLTKPIDAYGDGPTLELTASGVHYISGPYVVEKIKDIEGTFDAATLGDAAPDVNGVIRPNAWNNILSWYESLIVAVPSPGSDFPISQPTATAEKKIVDGSTTTIYTVSIQLGTVI